MTRRAWVATEKNEYLTAIVFADTRGRARVYGAAELDSSFLNINVRRIPEFDQYAEVGRVPTKAMLEQGFLMPCNRCDDVHFGDGDIAIGEATLIDDEVYCVACAAKLTPKEVSRP